MPVVLSTNLSLKHLSNSSLLSLFDVLRIEYLWYCYLPCIILSLIRSRVCLRLISSKNIRLLFFTLLNILASLFESLRYKTFIEERFSTFNSSTIVFFLKSSTNRICRAILAKNWRDFFIYSLSILLTYSYLFEKLFLLRSSEQRLSFFEIML